MALSHLARGALPCFLAATLEAEGGELFAVLYPRDSPVTLARREGEIAAVPAMRDRCSMVPVSCALPRTFLLRCQVVASLVHRVGDVTESDDVRVRTSSLSSFSKKGPPRGSCRGRER